MQIRAKKAFSNKLVSPSSTLTLYLWWPVNFKSIFFFFFAKYKFRRSWYLIGRDENDKFDCFQVVKKNPTTNDRTRTRRQIIINVTFWSASIDGIGSESIKWLRDRRWNQCQLTAVANLMFRVPSQWFVFVRKFFENFLKISKLIQNQKGFSRLNFKDCLHFDFGRQRLKFQDFRKKLFFFINKNSQKQNQKIIKWRNRSCVIFFKMREKGKHENKKKLWWEYRRGILLFKFWHFAASLDFIGARTIWENDFLITCLAQHTV